MRLALGLLAVLAAGPAAAQSHVITGHVSFRDRLALPPTAVVRVDLLAHGDGARVIATSERSGSGQSPIPFQIAVDRAALRRAARHSLSAQITVGGRLWFVNERAVDLPDGPPFEAVGIRVVRVGAR